MATHDDSDAAFKQAVVKALEAFPDGTVSILTVSDAAIMLRPFSISPISRVTETSMAAITVTYLYSVMIEAAGFQTGQDAFEYATKALSSSVSSGEFTSLLQNAAAEFGSDGLLWAVTAENGLNIHTDFLSVNSSPKPSIAPTHKYPYSRSDQNSLQIIGPALALVVIVLASYLVYHRFIRNKADDNNFIPLSQDIEGYDEIELMEKKAQLVSLSQHGTNPLHRLKRKNRKKFQYTDIMNMDDDPPPTDIGNVFSEDNGARVENNY